MTISKGEVTDGMRRAMLRAPTLRAPTINVTPHDDHANPSGIPNTEQRERAKALEGGGEDKAQSPGIPLVRYLLCRVQLLDVDAKFASVKDTLDGLAKAGLISGDREGEITLEVEQKKVAHYKEERTEITITYP